MSRKRPKGEVAPEQTAGDAPTTVTAPDAAIEEVPDNLDFVFAELKQQLKDQLARLGQVGREVALAVAARIDADAAIAETALGSLELEDGKKKRRRAHVRRLERLLERVTAVEAQASRGRRRDLRRVAKSVRRIVTSLTEPVA